MAFDRKREIHVIHKKRDITPNIKIENINKKNSQYSAYNEVAGKVVSSIVCAVKDISREKKIFGELPKNFKQTFTFAKNNTNKVKEELTL